MKFTIGGNWLLSNILLIAIISLSIYTGHFLAETVMYITVFVIAISVLLTVLLLHKALHMEEVLDKKIPINKSETTSITLIIIVNIIIALLLISNGYPLLFYVHSISSVSAVATRVLLRKLEKKGIIYYKDDK